VCKGDYMEWEPQSPGSHPGPRAAGNPLSGASLNIERENPEDALERAKSGRVQPEPSAARQPLQHRDCFAVAIQENPYGAVAAAVGAGILIGLIVGVCGRR
jgi:ElaB/YqjD/DUF883 family membrane-anchored ribosome-binding protein